MENSNIVTQTADALKKISDDPKLIKKTLKYGSTPVYYVPTRAMYRKPPIPGLSQLISQSMTVKEVENLLNVGKTQYKKAQPKTIRKWEQAAATRLEQLRQQ